MYGKQERAEKGGEPQQSGGASAQCTQGAALAQRRPDLIAMLTPAQQPVLFCLLSGQTGKQIAGRLAKSEHTVHDHIKGIYQRLSVSTRTQLVLLFAALGQGGPGEGNLRMN